MNLVIGRKRSKYYEIVALFLIAVVSGAFYIAGNAIYNLFTFFRDL